MEAAGNTESNCGLKEEGLCGDVAVVRIGLRIVDEVTAGVILKHDDDQVLVVLVMLVMPILVLVLVEMGVVVGGSHK